MDLIRKIQLEIEKKIKTLDRSFRDEFLEIGGLEYALEIIDECVENNKQQNCIHEIEQINTTITDFYGKCVNCGKYFK